MKYFLFGAAMLLLFVLVRLLRPTGSIEKILRIVEKEVAGTVDDTEWDFFVSVPLQNASLERIRRECIALDQLPTTERQQHLQKVLKDLRALIK